MTGKHSRRNERFCELKAIQKLFLLASFIDVHFKLSHSIDIPFHSMTNLCDSFKSIHNKLSESKVIKMLHFRYSTRFALNVNIERLLLQTIKLIKTEFNRETISC